MARIILIQTAPVSRSFLSLAQNIVKVQAQSARLLAVVDQITANGTAKANLETATEALFPVGTGTALYNGLAQINTALAGLAATVSSIDQGA